MKTNDYCDLYPLVHFTVGRTASGEPQSKHHAIGEDGKISTSPPRFASSGTLKHVCAPLNDFGSHFHEPNSFAVLGVPAGTSPDDEVLLTTSQQESRGSGGIARTTENLVWPEGNSLLMLDVDLKSEHTVPAMPAQLEGKEAIALIEQTLGLSLQNVAYLIRPSASSGVYRESDGKLLKNSSGFHVYFALKGSTPDKVLECITKRLVIAGRGYSFINRCGRILVRTLFDAAVGQTNRVDFAASPTVGDGLIHRPPEDVFVPGRVLDLTHVDLTVDEGVYDAAVKTLRAQPGVKELQAERLDIWIQARAAHLEDAMSPEEALIKASNLGQRIHANETVDLFVNDEVLFVFDHGDEVSLARLLERPEEYDGLSLADPFDEASEPCKAKFFANTETGKPCIHSFAHGGVSYFLHAGDERHLYFPNCEERPCFRVYDEKCGYPGYLTKAPGLYEHKAVMQGRGDDRELVAVDTFIAAPLHVTAGTSDERGNSHGLVLGYKDIQGRLHRWAMPREMIGDAGDGLVRVLADGGLQFDHDNRKRIPAYLASEKPERRLTSVATTGWIALPGDPWSFVTPGRVIGSEKLIFQSSTYHHEGMPSTGGTLLGWQENIGWLARHNPMLMISICVALAGPLIRHLSSAESGGIHLQGPSSIGKSTCLVAAVSVWGGADFLRQWRATSNGLEAIAAMLTDTCLILDEINEVEPKHLGQSVYMLANGRGKTRARQDSSARAVKTWRLTYISSGELTPAEYMRMDNTRIQAGQEMRLLNIPVNRVHGAFDELHSLSSGAELSDEIKASSRMHYGHAGVAFVEALVRLLTDQSSRVLDSRLDEITRQLFTAGNSGDAQAGRAAKKFAVFALAGELATDWGIVPWASGDAIAAACECFSLWRQDFGEGPSESRKILEAIRDYIDQHGPNRFVHLSITVDSKSASDPKGNYIRSGWIDKDADGERVYLFHSEGLKAAAKGFSVAQVTKTLDEAGWLAMRGKDGKASVTRYIDGESHRVYYIKPRLDG